MSTRRMVALAVVGFMLVAMTQAQRRRDPLTEKESDELRELSQEPIRRIKLLVTFARARMSAIEQLRANPKLAQDRDDQIHTLLEDFANIIDEMDDNLEMFDRRHEDLRKPLKEVIEADTEWQLKLRTLREDKSLGGNKEFAFVLDNATESVNASADSARTMLEDQNASHGKEKEKGSDKADRKGREGER